MVRVCTWLYQAFCMPTITPGARAGNNIAEAAPSYPLDKIRDCLNDPQSDTLSVLNLEHPVYRLIFSRLIFQRLGATNGTRQQVEHEIEIKDKQNTSRCNYCCGSLETENQVTPKFELIMKNSTIIDGKTIRLPSTRHPIQEIKDIFSIQGIEYDSDEEYKKHISISGVPFTEIESAVKEKDLTKVIGIFQRMNDDQSKLINLAVKVRRGMFLQ